MRRGYSAGVEGVLVGKLLAVPLPVGELLAVTLPVGELLAVTLPVCDGGATSG